MFILTTENLPLDLDLVGGRINDIRYSVFDYSTPKDPDYYFKPLIFLDSFNDCVLKLNVGGNRIQVPKDWSILMADPETGDVEIIPVDDINARRFCAFTFNPITGFYPKFTPIKLEDVFMDVRCVFPKLDHHNFLVVPLTKDKNPDCILLINEKDQKKIPLMTIDILL